MAQHRCITQLAKNFYRARPTAVILTIDSRLNNYSFRLKTHTFARYTTSFIYPFLPTQPSLSTVRDPRTRRSYILGSTSSETNYLFITFLFHGQHLARPWDRTMSVGPTVYKIKTKITKMAVLILVAFFFQDVEDVLCVRGSGRVVRLDCWG